MRRPAWWGLSAKLHPTPRERTAAWLLVSSYAFGTVMLATDAVPGFVYLTAFHLVFTAVLLCSAHRPHIGWRVVIWLLICGVLGWWIEYLGVHGGWLFGRYIYGDVLGPKVNGIPLVLGVNWILVVYAVATTLSMALPRLGAWAKVPLAAAALTFLDLLIEPTAIALDFWTWADGTPPLQNYVGWFGVSLVQGAIFYVLLPFTENRLAPLVLLLQLGFFGVLALVL